MEESYCKYCQQNTQLTKRWNWATFIVLLLIGGLGIVYPLFYLAKPKNLCHKCHAKIA